MIYQPNIFCLQQVAILAMTDVLRDVMNSTYISILADGSTVIVWTQTK